MPIHHFHFSRIKLPFFRTKYTRFKGNIKIYMKKHIIIIQCMIDYWHFYGTASSSTLLAISSIHFYLIFNWHGISRLCTGNLFLLQSILSTVIIFIQRVFVLSGSFHRQYFFPDFVKFKYISKTWKMNLLFSKFSKTRGNPAFTDCKLRTLNTCLGQFSDEILCIRLPASLYDIIHGDIIFAKSDIFSYCCIKQNRLLANNTYLLT